MKAYIVVAFLTLAAVVSATSPYRTAAEKKEYLKFLESKFKSLKDGKTRDISARDTCRIKKCGSSGDSCNGDIICNGLKRCINNTCRSSREGDICDYYDDDEGCFNPSLYCDRDRCRKYARIGDMCSNNADCVTHDDDKNELYCNVDTQEYRGVGHCRPKVKNVGDVCEYDYRWYCNFTVAYCTATNMTQPGVCKALPKVVNEPCDPENGYNGCNIAMNLYCSEQSKKCLELPKTGQECLDGVVECYPGYYCDGDNKCAKLKGKGEECEKSSECEGALRCIYNSVDEKRMCMNSIAKEREYCDYSYYPTCEPPLVCEDSKCVDKGYECVSNDDCPDFTYYCDNHTCRGGMQLEEGEECGWSSSSFGIPSALQCKPGLLCARNSSYDSTYVCKKAISKKGDLNYCSYDSDCPYDATCECDDNIGLSVCVPRPKSSNKLRNLYKNYMDNDGENEDDLLALYEYLVDDHFYYSAEYRCGAYIKELSSASTIRASVITTIIFVLFTFLLF